MEVMVKMKVRLAARGLCALLLGVLLQAQATPVQAATEYFYPSSGQAEVGKSLTVSVYASSPDQAASAFSGYLSFPADKLSVTSVSKAGSIITIWVAEPSYSNANGTLSFEGILPNPGFTGTGGKLLTITFSVRSAGAANIAFTSGAVLANDGLGTNITLGTGSASFTLSEPGAPTPTEETPATPGKPVFGAPEISSSTHPAQNVWYTNNDPVFKLVLPAGVKGVNVLANQTENSDPGTVSDGTKSEYEYPDVEDGVWYLHARLQNDNGWGQVAHFKFQIDTLAPEPFVVTALEPAGEGKNPAINFTVVDATSGIDHYILRLDQGEDIVIPADELVLPYELPRAKAGDHAVTVVAVDGSGNSRDASLTVTYPDISPRSIWPALQEARFADALVALIVLVKYLLLISLAALISTLVLLVVVRSLRYLRLSHKPGVHEQVRAEARVKRDLRAADKDLQRDIKRLEATKRAKRLSPSAEKKVSQAVRSLKAVDAEVIRTKNA